VKNPMVVCFLFLLGVAFATARQNSGSDEGGRVLALEKVWSRALEQKDSKALDMLLANTLVSVQGSRLSAIPSGDGTQQRASLWRCGRRCWHFSRKRNGQEKSFSHRERFVGTWIKINGVWQCVAKTSNLIAAKQAAG
jgi:hypothetical protein